ncbi:MAG: O-antigen ligase family protein [Deltaproteobacteria bacterium]|nr:O-antigen ligase family protein [Deltaproteobacteria bacterium]
MLGLFEGPAEIACALVVVTALARRMLRLDDLRDPVIVGTALWIAAGIPGALSSTVKVSSEDSLRPLLSLALLAGTMTLPSTTPRTLRAMAIAFTAAITLNAGYGYLQLTFGALPLDRFLLKNPASPQIIDPVAWGRRGVSGLFYNRLKLAHAGILGLGLVTLIAIEPRVRRSTRAWCAASAAVIAPAVAMTGARMAVAAALIAIVFVIALTSSKRTLVVAAATAIVTAGLVAATPSGRARLRRAVSDTAIRHTIHAVAWNVFLESPILGVGHGTYRVRAEPHAAPGFSREWTVDAHSIPLHALAETGLVGTTGLLTAIGVALLRVIRRIRAGAEELVSSVTDRFSLYGLTAIACLGSFHFPMHHATIALAFWYLLALASRSHRIAEP